MRTVAARRIVRSAAPLDGVIQIGTGYMLPPVAPIVTFEDLTIRQAVRAGYPEWLALRPRAVRAGIERQRRAYEAAAACCVTTSWAATSIVDEYGIDPSKVHVVGLGRNHDPGRSERDWRRPRFLFVGRDWVGKNGPGLLHAFARVRTAVPDARLDVVGNHPPIDAPGVFGHGFLSMGDAGDRRKLERLYEAATCFVLPSHYEASAIVYLEAGAAGLPSIGTSVGGSADFIGDAGRLVDPADSDALVAAMLELADPDTAARLGGLALERSSLFTWKAVAERTLRALRPANVALDALAGFL